MKTGRSLQEIAVEIERQVKTRKDYVAPTEKLRMVVEADKGAPVAVLDGLNGGAMALRSLAHDQLGTECGIPTAYYRRMQTEAPHLLADNVNHWLQAQPRRRLVRTLDGQVRAWLSDRFRPLDNYDLAEVIFPALQQIQARVASVELTEKRLYIKIVQPSVQWDMAMAKREAMIAAGRGTHEERPAADVVQAAVVIANSEVGLGTFSIDEAIERLSCYNLATVTKAVKQYHVGKRQDGFDDEVRALLSNEARQADDQAFFLKARDVVKGSLSAERLQINATKFAAAAGDKITAPIDMVVERVVEKFNLAEGIRTGVLQHLAEGGDLTRFGLINAVTRASQDVDDYDLATDLERVGGKIIILEPGEWRALATSKN